MEMNYEAIVAGLVLFVTIIINIVMVAFFAGQLHTQQQQQEKMISLIRQEFKDNFERLEKKQDKHNNLIERMTRVEDSCKSVWKKMKEIYEVQHDCIFRKGEYENIRSGKKVY